MGDNCGKPVENAGFGFSIIFANKRFNLIIHIMRQACGKAPVGVLGRGYAANEKRRPTLKIYTFCRRESASVQRTSAFCVANPAEGARQWL
jgi:hypothetical protein